ncbi:MAG: hypothetical protein ACREQD_02565 [Candidatus Binataceae bacterium]
MMLGYMAFELNSGKYIYREDQLGDDLYYLGLLFTLVSLAWSLRLFGNRSASQIDLIDELIANFGIAILTTIVGLALRVVLYKWRGDELEEPELKSKIDLAQASGELKAQLLSAIEDMNGFRLGLSQSMTELVKDATGKISAAIQEGLGDVRHQAAVARDAVERALGGLSGTLARLNEGAAQLSVELDHLWKRVQSVEAPPDLLQKELAPTLKILARHARAIEKITVEEEERSRQFGATIGALSEFARQAEEQVHRIRRDADGLVDLGPGLQNAGREIETLVAAIAGANVQLGTSSRGLAQRLGGLAAEGNANLELVKKHREALEQEVVKSVEAVNKVHGALVSMTSLIVERLGNDGK